MLVNGGISGGHFCIDLRTRQIRILSLATWREHRPKYERTEDSCWKSMSIWVPEIAGDILLHFLWHTIVWARASRCLRFRRKRCSLFSAWVPAKLLSARPSWTGLHRKSLRIGGISGRSFSTDYLVISAGISQSLERILAYRATRFVQIEKRHYFRVNWLLKVANLVAPVRAPMANKAVVCKTRPTKRIRLPKKWLMFSQFFHDFIENFFLVFFFQSDGHKRSSSKVSLLRGDSSNLFLVDLTSPYRAVISGFSWARKRWVGSFHSHLMLKTLIAIRTQECPYTLSYELDNLNCNWWVKYPLIEKAFRKNFWWGVQPMMMKVGLLQLDAIWFKRMEGWDIIKKPKCLTIMDDWTDKYQSEKLRWDLHAFPTFRRVWPLSAQRWDFKKLHHDRLSGVDFGDRRSL